MDLKKVVNHIKNGDFESFSRDFLPNDAAMVNSQGRNLIHCCGLFGVKDVRILETRHIDPNLSDNDGSTPLICASGSGEEEVVKILLNNPKVDPNLANNDGSTPLLHASYFGKLDGEVEEELEKETTSKAKLGQNRERLTLNRLVSSDDEEMMEELLKEDNDEEDSEEEIGEKNAPKQSQKKKKNLFLNRLASSDEEVTGESEEEEEVDGEDELNTATARNLNKRVGKLEKQMESLVSMEFLKGYVSLLASKDELIEMEKKAKEAQEMILNLSRPLNNPSTIQR
eukprot:TRINITY_DN1056_c1_g1_i2.p1 TRINITY_DN1056_c1_g1~~TRINITY_DN1056_c1_g1_i2.p1  ORF type:complete len:284 (+),score=104.22 TRINITY_DN1056_c1_g1_i2:115-966(+)